MQTPITQLYWSPDLDPHRQVDSLRISACQLENGALLYEAGDGWAVRGEHGPVALSWRPGRYGVFSHTTGTAAEAPGAGAGAAAEEEWVLATTWYGCTEYGTLVASSPDLALVQRAVAARFRAEVEHRHLAALSKRLTRMGRGKAPVRTRAETLWTPFEELKYNEWHSDETEGQRSQVVGIRLTDGSLLPLERGEGSFCVAPSGLTLQVSLPYHWVTTRPGGMGDHIACFKQGQRALKCCPDLLAAVREIATSATDAHTTLFRTALQQLAG